MKFLTSDWCGLSWLPWYPFSAPLTFRQLPVQPGVYRIRAVGVEELFYIGETGRDLRGRLGDLRRNTMQFEMPFNDPHTAAPSLWAWHHTENLAFECSVAPVALTDSQEEARKRREGLEFYLLWQYRLEFGASTRCNHGRFHRRYTKSTNRKGNIRGKRLPDDTLDNLSGGESFPPLPLIATPSEENWMGLTWSRSCHFIPLTLPEIPIQQGVYKIFDSDTNSLLYVGETSNLKNRFITHAKKNWHCQQPLFSFVVLPRHIFSYQRHEIENDLLGGYYAQYQKTPTFQLMDHH